MNICQEVAGPQWLCFGFVFCVFLLITNDLSDWCEQDSVPLGTNRELKKDVAQTRFLGLIP
jgi:hypothetical protein